MSERISVLGKAGIFTWNTEVGGSLGAGDDGFDITFGVGAGYHFPGNFVGRLEWEWFQDVDEDDVSLLPPV